MKKKLVNRKVVNSIGVGILAAMTTCTSVYAATDGIPQEEENKQEENNEIEEQFREETEEEKQLTEAKDSLDEIVTEGVEEEVRETEESEESEIIKVEKDDINEEITSALEEAGEKIDGVQNVVTDLEDQNVTIETNNNIIEEIANSTEAGSMNQMTENIVETEKVAQDAVKTTEESKKTAEDVAGSVEEAQQKVYESSEAAQAAKEQAQTEVQEAEKALTEAQDANDEAEKKVDLLEAELEAVEQEKAKADAALEAAREAEAAAREALEELQSQVAQNGEGGYKYSGNAAEAIEKAKEALSKAQTDVENAKLVAEAAREAVESKEKELKDAEDAFREAEEDLAKANIKLDEAQEALEKAGEALDAANINQVSAQTRYDNAVTDEKSKGEELETAKSDYQDAQDDLKDAQDALDEHTKNDGLISDIQSVQNTMLEAFHPDEKTPYGSGYYVAGQELTKKLVEYKLLEDGEIESGDQVNFSEFHDVAGQADKNQNYVMASYEKEGETYVKYYDYEPDPNTGAITVIEKEVEYYGKNGNDNYKLVIMQKDGETVYSIKGLGGTFEVEEIEFIDGYYNVKKVPGYILNNREDYIGLYMPQFVTSDGSKGTSVFEGDSDAVVKEYDEKKAELKGTLEEKTSVAEDAYSKWSTAQTNYNVAKGELEDAEIALEAAKTAVEQKEKERNDAQGDVDSANNNVTEKIKLKDQMNKAVSNLQELLKGLKADSDSAATGVKNTKAIQIAVEKAYDKVEQAIQNLVNLSANTVNEAQYEALMETYDRAVTQYQSALAAKGVYGENLEAVKKAVDRARAAAEAEFRYNSSNNESDNTQGGTTDGGETGGTTDGGETGGTTDGGETGGTTGGEETGGTTGGGATNEGGTGTGGTTTDDGVTGGGAGGTTTDDGVTGGGAGGSEDEGGAATDTGVGTDTAAPTLVTTLADAEVPLAPTALTADTNTAMANAGAAMNANRRTAGNSIVRAAGEDELAGEEEDGLIVVEDEDVPLAAIDLETDEAEEKEEDLTVVADEEVPLANLDLEQEQSKMSWWWLLIVAICGATGYEMYRRHKKNQEQEEVR